MHPSLAALLVCPACGGDFLPTPGATCARCSRERAVDDGIVSLITDGAHTALDEIDYDAVYRVDADASHAFARSCLDLLGDRIPDRIETFLEIGAGTGLFTLGFLKQVPTKTAVITDISRQMLEVCRRRLVEHDVDRAVDLHFVTWDGLRCLRPGGVQFIAGFSVLHHVLDFPSMLKALREAMRPDGIALFLEPNYRFHVALLDTVSAIFANVVDDESQWTTDDKNALAAWLYENNTNVRFRGDERVLAGREDKHLFDGGQLRGAAATAGFSGVELVPFGDRSECYVALKVYSDQIGLTEAARNDLLLRFSRMLPGHFAHLAEEDLAPSSLIVLRAGGDAAASARAAISNAGLHGEQVPGFRYDLALTLDSEDGELRLGVEGWVLGDADATYVIAEVAGARLEFPVQWIRPDIQRVFNAGHTYPVRRALFSGVARMPPMRVDPMNAETPVGLRVITGDGREFPLGECSIGPASGRYAASSFAG